MIMPDLRAHGAKRQAARAGPIIRRTCWSATLRELIAPSRARPTSTSAAFRSARGRPSRRWRGGLRPRRAILGGTGLDVLHQLGTAQPVLPRRDRRFDSVQRGDPHWLSIQFMKTMKIDRVAAALLLDSA